jgi:hypothetical protein
MSRSVRRLRKSQEAQKALADLTRLVPKLQGGLRDIVKALPQAESGQVSDNDRLLAALVEDVEALNREAAVQRETFIRLLIALSEDSEENIRKVESTIREEVVKGFEGA